MEFGADLIVLIRSLKDEKTDHVSATNLLPFTVITRLALEWKYEKNDPLLAKLFEQSFYLTAEVWLELAHSSSFLLADKVLGGSSTGSPNASQTQMDQLQIQTLTNPNLNCGTAKTASVTQGWGADQKDQGVQAED